MRTTTRAAAIFVAVFVVGAWSGCMCGPRPFTQETDAAVVVDAELDTPPVQFDGGDAAFAPCETAQRKRDPLGCMYLAFAPIAGNIGGSFGCDVLLVSNPSEVPAQLDVTFRGVALDVASFGRRAIGQGANLTYAPLAQATLPAHETAIVALVQGMWSPLSPREKCPFPAAVGGDVMVKYDSVGEAFVLRSSAPVSVVHELHYNLSNAGPATATELRSTYNWDTRYREVGFYLPGRPPYIDAGDNGYPTEPSYTAVLVAAPSSVSLMRDGGKESYLLDAGSVFNRLHDDLSIGTLITSNVPIGVGVGAANIRAPYFYPYPANALESVDYHEVAPVSSWSDKYAAVRHPPRYANDDEVAIWRILGDADGTVLTYEPTAPPNAPTILGAGEMRVFEAPGPFVVRAQDAQHLIYVTQLMTSCGYSTCPTCTPCRGNVELVAVPPPEEYANSFAFFTDPSLPESHVVAVRRKGAAGFADVVSDCAGALGGWAPVGTGSEFEYTYVALSRGNNGVFVPQVYPSGTCDNGAHWMKSAGLFAITVWAWSNPSGWPPPPNENESIMSYGYVPFGVGPRPDGPPPH